MIKAVVMPKLGQSEETVKIVKWRKRVGEPVAKGDILLEIETDKAVLEVESFYAGTLLKTIATEGMTVPVQTTVAFIGDPGEAVPEVTAIPSGVRSSESGFDGASSEARGSAAEVKPEGGPGGGGRAMRHAPAAASAPQPLQASAVIAEPPLLRISPRALKLAKEAVIDPAPIQGTGPGGRIIEKDVSAYLEAQGYDRLRITPTAKKLAAREGIDLLTLTPKEDGSSATLADIEQILAERPKPMSRMRQIIAQRLTESYTRAPHFFVTVATDVTDLEARRAELKTHGVVYTLTDFILKSAALAIEQFPMINATSDGSSLRQRTRIDLGLAVALEQGLVVPVIRRAGELTLAEIHTRAQELTAKARAGQLTPAEMTGSTFTISNLGMMDVENFTAIINPGESAILAVASVRKQPVVIDDAMAIRAMMKMTLSSDHRLIDGALAARFINAIRKNLEDKSLWQRLTSW